MSWRVGAEQKCGLEIHLQVRLYDKATKHKLSTQVSSWKLRSSDHNNLLLSMRPLNARFGPR